MVEIGELKAENSQVGSTQAPTHCLLDFRFLFSHSISRSPLGSLITVQVCIFRFVGEGDGMSFFDSRLKTKCCKEDFHYYEVVFEADDDLQGLRTERAHFSSPFHLAILGT